MRHRGRLFLRLGSFFGQEHVTLPEEAERIRRLELEAHGRDVGQSEK